LLRETTWNRKRRIENEGESTGEARRLWTSASRAAHPGRTKTVEKVPVPISTIRAGQMELALSKASVTVRLEKSMLFLSPTELMPNRLRQMLSRPIRNSSVEIGAVSEHQHWRAKQTQHRHDRPVSIDVYQSSVITLMSGNIHRPVPIRDTIYVRDAIEHES
jgi:hypothetical protein